MRGGNAQNDATRADAHAVGMDALVPILDNGSCIPGTELAYCGESLLREFSRADVILSKGQGNFECLLGCGQNVYYLFLQMPAPVPHPIAAADAADAVK